MECVIDSKKLSENLAYVASVAPKRSVKETLSMMKITTKGKSIEMKATDLVVELKTTISDVDVKKEGVCLVNASKLNSIVGSFNDKISLKQTAKNLVIKCGKSTFKLALGNPDEYVEICPEDKVIQSTKLETDAFANLIDNVSFAADTAMSDVTYSYDTILLDGEKDTLNCVALDGTRVSFGKIKCEKEISKFFRLFSPKVFTLLKKINRRQTHLELKEYKNILVFEVGNFSYSIRPVVGKMPDYQKVLTIPDGYHYVDIDRKELLRIVKQMLVISNIGYKSIWLLVEDGKLTVYTDVVDNNEARVEVNVVTNINSTFKMKLNAESLYDILKVIDCETVQLIFTGEEEPLHIKWEDYHYLIVPLMAL